MSASAPQRADQKPPFADKYAIERVIGRGGMGTVFEARHVRLGHRVAIKVLGEDLRTLPELVKRFEREARAASALSSPHAVRVFDIDATDDGTPFMVMELLHGHDLAHRLDRDGAQPVGLAVRWVIEACDAIAEAHRRGIIHRDIKPSNLLLCESGSIKVLDFGIAKRVASKEAAITLGFALLGTPQYMSPEQIRCAKDVDARTDIWSLGVTLYELVCGRPPFNHDIPQACIAAIVADPVPEPRDLEPNLPAELAAVIMRALSKDVAKRFQSVGELVCALAPFAADAPVVDIGPRATIITRTRRLTTKALAKPILPRAIPLMERNRAVVALATAVVLGLAALVAVRSVGASIQASSTSAAAIAAPEGDLVARAAAPPVAATVNGESPAPARPGPPDATPAIVVTTAPSSSRPVAEHARTITRPVTSSAARVIGSESAVHGGISSPGF